MTARDAHQSPTEFKDIILSYPTIKKVMADPHYEILWADNSGAGLGATPQKIMEQEYITHQSRQ